MNCLYWAERSAQLKLSTLSVIENAKARPLNMGLSSWKFRALLFLKLTQMAKVWHWIISWVQHTARSSMGRVKTWAPEIFISLVITSGLLAELYHCSWAGFAWAKMECLICLAISLFFWLVYPFHQMHSENIYFTAKKNLTERDVSLISMLESFCGDMDLSAPRSLWIRAYLLSIWLGIEHQSRLTLFNLL